MSYSIQEIHKTNDTIALLLKPKAGNTSGGSIIVQLTSCLTDLEMCLCLGELNLYCTDAHI